MQRSTSLAALAATALLAFGSAASAQTNTGISINFATNEGPSTLAPTAAAGVVPLTNFNNETNGTGTALALVNSTGAATTTTLTYTANNGTFHTGLSPSSGPNQTLLTGYIDTASAGEKPAMPTTTVSFAGITYTTYNVYVYTATNTSGYPDTRTNSYTISGAASGNTTLTATQPKGDEFANGFVRGQNYLLFSGLSGSSFLLSAATVSFAGAAGDAGFLRAGINGIQIVPAAAPEPSQAAALGLGVLGLGALVLRARRRTHAQS